MREEIPLTGGIQLRVVAAGLSAATVRLFIFFSHLIFFKLTSLSDLISKRDGIYIYVEM